MQPRFETPAPRRTRLMQPRIQITGLCCALLLTWLVNDGVGSERRMTPLVNAVQRVEKSVVNIHTEKTQSKDPVFGSPKKVNGMGTGVIVDERGYIVTNEHVIHNVDQDAIRVELIDGTQAKANVISFDSRQDLAIIKVDFGRSLPVAPFGTSCDLMRGETVFAVGNAFGYTHTITRGIISALGRNVEVNEKIGYKNLIQTDASINPGNSGGPLVNLDGEVIGINVAIRAGAQRIGFTIPIDDARRTISRLLDNEKFGTYHGLLTKDVRSPETKKMVVSGTHSDSPAFQAGLLPGDEVLKAGKVAVSDRADFERALLGINPGKEVPVTVRRDGSEVALQLRIGRNGERPLTNIVARANNGDTSSYRGDTPQQMVWRILGLRFRSISQNQLPNKYQKHYKGGLQVIEVRANGPAAAKGVKSGDVVVGLALWEAYKITHVTYAFNQQRKSLTANSAASELAPVKCHIIRGEQIIEKTLSLPLQD